MAKTIKFNLICDGNPIRTIEDLQNNFSVEDVLAYYGNRLLQRWLEVRGYKAELEQVLAINSEKNIDIAKELIRIFEVAADEKKIEESVYMLEYLNEREELYKIYENNKYDVDNIIDDYMKGYNVLVDSILDNPYDVAVIKANIAEIIENYEWLFKYNHRELFWILREKSDLALMCLLLNEKTRRYFLPVKLNSDDKIEYDIDTEPYKDKKEMYNYLCDLIKKPDYLKTQLGDEFQSFAGVTDGYWKDLEPKEKKYMIISMGQGDYVRSAGKTGEEFAKSQIDGVFRILDGIDYKSNSSSRKLYYMEV